ncbi:MAG: hypothetical protein CM15mP102_09370 [Flavobacteriales bacterium]|nr:MAG: hypothetical protein CM15mP102_09370 [Flavobacteriales bacterium]
MNLSILFKHPEINVVVCEDRRKGMNIILKNLSDTELCIWDDVFQHRFVKPGLMILSTTFQYPFIRMRFFQSEI